MSDDAIEIEMVYPHPVERVWRALTSREALAAWLMPNDFEPRVGHEFTFRAPPQEGWNGVVRCRVTALDELRRVAYTWRGGDGLLDTLVTFTLEPLAEGEGTRLRLEHTGFAAGGPVGLTIRDILATGWDSKLLREQLPALLERLAAQSA